MRGLPSWSLLSLLAALTFPACGGSIASVEVPGNDAGSDAAAPSPLGGICGRTQVCVAGAYCDVGATCGTAGTCATKPTACTDIGQPVCGCDGLTYGNPCTAAGAGVSVARLGACTKPPTPVPPGQLFACGTILCDAGTQYCQRSLSDVPPITESDACLPLPASCAHTASCACFPAGTPCVSAATCKQIPTAKGPNYGFEITCPGG